MAASLPVLGCGDGDDGDEPLSKDEYQSAILEIVRNREPEVNGLFLDLVVGPLPEEDCAEKAEAFHAEVEELVEEIAALQPPANVAPIQDEFIAAARQSVDRVGEVADQVQAGDVSCGPEINDLIYSLPSSDRAEKAIGELERNGYVVFGD
jgi:hypothetical protein